MDLLAFLRTIPADPEDPASPKLWAVSDELGEYHEDYILGSTYARRPYAVVVGLPSNRTGGLHDGSGFFTALVDVHLLQPATIEGKTPSPGTLKHIIVHARHAHRHVDALPDQQLLAAPLTLEAVMPPQERDADDGGGLEATLRFRATIHF